MKITAIFEAEMYEIYDESGNLFNSVTSYQDLCDWAEFNGHEIVSVTGLDDEDESEYDSSITAIAANWANDNGYHQDYQQECAAAFIAGYNYANALIPKN